jgi:DNA sulfur modification protein DndC
MSKQAEKLKEEAELLKKSCTQEPKDVELIQDLLALQKTKTLMIRKRGLQSDIDNRLNQFIEELKNESNGKV